MSEVLESDDVDELSGGGSALGRVLRRSLNLKRGKTEKPVFRGGEGWSKRAKSVIAAYNDLLAVYDRLVLQRDAMDDDQAGSFVVLKAKVHDIEDKRVGNNKKEREAHKKAIEDLTQELEELEASIEVSLEMDGRPSPPPRLSRGSGVESELDLSGHEESGTESSETPPTISSGPPPSPPMPPPPPPPPPMDVEEEIEIAPIEGDKLDVTELQEMLKDVEQALHRAGSKFGGLGFCITHINDFADPDEEDEEEQERNKARVKYLKELKAYNDRRVKLAGELKQEELSEEGLARLSNEVRGLHDKMGKKITEGLADKREKSVDAVKECGFGEEAQKAIAQLVNETRSIKITDAPNPFYGDEERWNNSPLQGEAKEMFNPANRYVHTDGDEKVNAAKTAAAKVARALVPEIDLEGVKNEIREQEGKKQRGEVVRKKGKEIKDRVIRDYMMNWYRTTGAGMLSTAKEDKFAEMWRGGDVIFSMGEEGSEVSLDEGLVERINEAAQAALETFTREQLDGAVAGAIDNEVEAIITLKANAKRAKMVEAQTMTQGDYWTELGRLAKSSDVGRCFSCAGVAAQALVMNPAFDGATIESVGAVSYDHHFVLVGRKGAEVGSTTPPGMDSKVLVVDIWQANQGGDPPAATWATFQYNTETKLKVFCVMKPGKERAELRERCLEHAKKQAE